MKRIFLVLGVLAGLGTLGLSGGCNKPATEDCRKALSNMQRLLGTEDLSKNGDFEGEVRRCKGGSSRDAVACAIKATTLPELKACQFMAPPAK